MTMLVLSFSISRSSFKMLHLHRHLRNSSYSVIWRPCGFCHLIQSNAEKKLILSASEVTIFSTTSNRASGFMRSISISLPTSVYLWPPPPATFTSSSSVFTSSGVPSGDYLLYIYCRTEFFFKKNELQ